MIKINKLGFFCKVMDVSDFGVKQVLLGNSDCRRTLLVCIRKYMHSFGRDQSHHEGLPTLDLTTINYIQGVFPTLTKLDLVHRIQNNNNNATDFLKFRTVREELLRYGEIYLPDKYRQLGIIAVVSKCLTDAVLDIANQPHTAESLTNVDVENLLNSVCLSMYKRGMFSDSKEMQSTFDTAAYYITDTLWFSLEPHNTTNLGMLFPNIKFTKTFGTSIESLSVREAYSSFLPIDAEAEANLFTPPQFKHVYRWYSAPLKRLSMWMKTMIDGAKMCLKEYSVLGGELFPAEFRVGYAGGWIIVSDQGTSTKHPSNINQELIHINYKGFGPHDLHPMFVVPSSYDMSVLQCVDKVGWSNYTCTRSRGFSAEMQYYEDARELCKIISLNYHRMHRIYVSFKRGLSKVLALSYANDSFRSFFAATWMCLQPPLTEGVFTPDMDEIFKTYVGLKGVKSPKKMVGFVEHTLRCCVE